MIPYAPMKPFLAISALLTSASFAAHPGPEPAAAVAPASSFQEVFYPSEKVREQAYFEICDHDRNGWISYREAVHSLRLTRLEFPVYDTDKDGRITRLEFGLRYRRVVDQAGAFQEPLLGSGPTAAISRNPEQLLRAFDQNADRSIDQQELKHLFSVYGRETLSEAVYLSELDRDGDGSVQGVELTALARVLTAPIDVPDTEEELAAKPASIDELFGEVIPRRSVADSAPQPPRIPGPVTHFRRLDLDNDGKITMDDLRRLQSPLQVKARASAALATLDLNGDEVVDYQEFITSM